MTETIGIGLATRRVTMRTLRTVLLLAVVVTPAFARAASADPADALPKDTPAPTDATPSAPPAADAVDAVDAAAAAEAAASANPVQDAALLAGLLRLEQALSESDPSARALDAGEAIRALAVLGDARALPALDRLSRQTQPASANDPPVAPLAVAAGTQSPSRSSLPPLPNTAPKLLVSGSTYSDNPAWRILIVNGQLFREGESPATGIKIEKIGVRAAVLQYEGSSFLLKY